VMIFTKAHAVYKTHFLKHTPTVGMTKRTFCPQNHCCYVLNVRFCHIRSSGTGLFGNSLLAWKC
jgi:hypothetical protein